MRLSSFILSRVLFILLFLKLALDSCSSLCGLTLDSLVNQTSLVKRDRFRLAGVL